MILVSRMLTALCLISATVSACSSDATGDAPFEPVDPTTPTPKLAIEAEGDLISSPPSDQFLGVFVLGPDHASPLRSYALKFHIESQGSTRIAEIALLDGDMIVASLFSGNASVSDANSATYPVDHDTLTRGDLLVRVTAWQGGERNEAVAELPAFAGGVSIQPTSATRTDDGRLWVSTARDGLVAASPESAVHYPGVASADAYDPAYAGPQSDLVLDVTSHGNDVWIATATTGVSRLSADGWRHAQPPTNDLGEDFNGKEARETATAIVADADGAWVGTLDGLYRLDTRAEPWVWSRVADGPVLALSVSGDSLWAGFSTPILVDASDPNSDVWLGAQATLLRHTIATGESTYFETGAITALEADPAGAWVGTPDGLLRAEGETLVEVSDDLGLPAVLAVTDLDLEPDGTTLWVAARDECRLGSGLLLKATAHADGTFSDIVDFSEVAGLVGRDFTMVEALGDGDALISTVVVLAFGNTFTSSGCAIEGLQQQQGGAFLFDATTGRATRYLPAPSPDSLVHDE